MRPGPPWCHVRPRRPRRCLHFAPLHVSAVLLPNLAVFDQGGSAALRRGPGFRAGLSLGRPARRAPGPTRAAAAITKHISQVG